MWMRRLVPFWVDGGNSSLTTDWSERLFGLIVSHHMDPYGRYVGHDDLRFADFQRAGTLGEVRILNQGSWILVRCVSCVLGCSPSQHFSSSRGLEKVPTWSNLRHHETRRKKQGKRESQHSTLWHSIGTDRMLLMEHHGSLPRRLPSLRFQSCLKTWWSLMIPLWRVVGGGDKGLGTWREPGPGEDILQHCFWRS